jgi:hypothetical protein
MDYTSTWKNRYPKGPVTNILAQLGLFVGCMFSIAAILDCRFVDATIDNSVGDFPELESYLPTDSRRGLGFYFWELENGKCSWDLGDDLTGTLRDDYVDFLGGDWRAPRGIGTTATALSWLIWVFSCAAHLRTVRYAVAALCLVLLVVFQSVTFAVITSDFCDDADCDLGRAAGFSIAGVLCFFFSGLVFLVMKDHPGDEDAEAAAATGKGAHEEAYPADTEEPTVEHVEDDQPTKEVVNEVVLNVDIAEEAQEIEVPSDPFVGSAGTLIKAAPD